MIIISKFEQVFWDKQETIVRLSKKKKNDGETMFFFSFMEYKHVHACKHGKIEPENELPPFQVSELHLDSLGFPLLIN